ncbi:dihydrolipoamide acetyltransferase family protein [Corynebacterium sp.]|jgi:pyruvate dehydrogenase E2 component (dihydrolipoamide acetyltransferase)|uniref:dihydrolipoamide acetyltransferase family protein n=1 Tax=Corynebacterium sp. TaxID=1720 RepID=UPI0025C04504|nr:dihydrolipoamide acetyltransferase family protein [Corynebacterium sp.]
MAYSFIMPELGEGLAEGTISNWLVAEGDTVEEDQDLVEIENDKAVTELPSPVDGTVQKINFGPGDVAKVGDVLIVIDDGSPDTEGDTVEDADHPAVIADATAHEEHSAKGGADEAVTAQENPVNRQTRPAAPTEPGTTPTDVAPLRNGDPAVAEAQGTRVLAMPSVLRYARERDVDITTVTPTGAHGHVTRGDIDRAYGAYGAPKVAEAADAGAETASEQDAAASSPVAAAPAPVRPTEDDRREAYAGIPAATGRAMSASHASIPPVTNFGEVEVSRLLKLQKKYKEHAAEQDVHLTVLPFIVKALVAAMKKYPVLNGALDTETNEIVYHAACNVAIATDTPRGLYAPVVKDADRANVLEIAKVIGDNAGKAAEGKLSADDMSGAGVTVSNLGGVDGGWFTPIISVGQSAILGVGRAVKAPYVNDEGELAVGRMMKLSLTYDHRIIDGVRGQEILNTVMQLLHDPNLLVIEG